MLSIDDCNEMSITLPQMTLIQLQDTQDFMCFLNVRSYIINNIILLIIIIYSIEKTLKYKLGNQTNNIINRNERDFHSKL